MKSLICFAVAFVGVLSLSARAAEKISCQDMVEGFCDKLWAKPQLGNMDLKIGDQTLALRLGRTENDIDQTRFVFLSCLQKHFADLPADVQRVFKKTDFQKNLVRYLRRKKPADQKLVDLTNPEYAHPILTSLDEVMTVVGWERTEKQHPGYIHLSSSDISSEIGRDFDRHRSEAWSEVFKGVWAKETSWQTVQKLFLQAREEYVHLIEEDKTLPEVVKKSMLGNLATVKMSLPGENPAFANASRWRTCGIDLKNAVYRPSYHELTICAGEFSSGWPLLTLAHEMGHSFSIAKRLLDYWTESDYGKSILSLWQRTNQGHLLSCTEWQKAKTELTSQVHALSPYKYEDAGLLDKFIDRKLQPIPEGSELNKLATRLSKVTLREEVNNRSLENIIKPEEILPSGSKVQNYRYLNPTINDITWPNPPAALSSDNIQFELFFTQEYSCQLEKKVPEKEALGVSIEEATRMTLDAWSMWIRVPGKYSYFQESRNEEFAQDVEEDVVDAFASNVVSRILKKIESLPERRNAYLSSLAGYCDRPSFQQQYPEETSVLYSFSNQAHSRGKDRRNKLITPAVREALECR